MAKKRFKASKRRLIVFGTLSVLCIIYLVYSFATSSYKLYQLQNEKTQLNDEILELEDQEQMLRTEEIKLQDDDYIASYAREKYLYSKDGEYILKINEEEVEDIPEEEDNRIYWIIPVSSVFIIMILKKKH
jgi:cell division protein DivIC